MNRQTASNSPDLSGLQGDDQYENGLITIRYDRKNDPNAQQNLSPDKRGMRAVYAVILIVLFLSIIFVGTLICLIIVVLVLQNLYIAYWGCERFSDSVKLHEYIPTNFVSLKPVYIDYQENLGMEDDPDKISFSLQRYSSLDGDYKIFDYDIVEGGTNGAISIYFQNTTTLSSSNCAKMSLFVGIPKSLNVSTIDLIVELVQASSNFILPNFKFKNIQITNTAFQTSFSWSQFEVVDTLRIENINTVSLVDGKASKIVLNNNGIVTVNNLRTNVLESDDCVRLELTNIVGASTMDIANSGSTLLVYSNVDPRDYFMGTVHLHSLTNNTVSFLYNSGYTNAPMVTKTETEGFINATVVRPDTTGLIYSTVHVTARATVLLNLESN